MGNVQTEEYHCEKDIKNVAYTPIYLSSERSCPAAGVARPQAKNNKPAHTEHLAESNNKAYRGFVRTT
jgi:hypothetical protein